MGLGIAVTIAGVVGSLTTVASTARRAMCVRRAKRVIVGPAPAESAEYLIPTPESRGYMGPEALRPAEGKRRDLWKFERSSFELKLPPCAGMTHPEQIIIDRRHAALARKYHSRFARAFMDQKLSRVVATHEGQAIRRRLKPAWVRRVMARDIEKLCKRYNAVLNELSVVRLSATDRRSDRGKTTTDKNGWGSELWHTDNRPDTMFKILIYLTDVGPDNAPFEYKYPVEYVPFNAIGDDTGRRECRGVDSRIAAGPAGTCITFKQNCLHKGNYARVGHRDVIMLSLELLD